MNRTMKILAIPAAIAGLTACSWLTPAHVVDVGTIAACVIAHDQDPVETIAVECAIQDQQQIRDILAAHKEASKREGKWVCP